nr:E3 ubiquitin-protein ligase Os03g0188200-like [Aegilops tauschii subsp. strangulata]
MALDLEVAAVLAVAVLIVALALAASGACRDDAGAAAAAEDVERALGDATLVAYAQVGEAARARQRCCAFCQSEYAKAPEEVVRVVPACGHFFHAACDADRWIRARRTCPLCRGALWPSAPRLPGRAAVVVVVVP